MDVLDHVNTWSDQRFVPERGSISICVIHSVVVLMFSKALKPGWSNNREQVVSGRNKLLLLTQLCQGTVFVPLFGCTLFE